MPIGEVHAQWMSVENTADLEEFKKKIEEQKEEEGTQVVYFDDQYEAFIDNYYEPSVPGKFGLIDQSTQMYMQQKRNELLVQDNENYIQLLINGNYNSATVMQGQGKGNIMNLGFYGNSNTGVYFQQGKNNYIFDRIGRGGSPVYDVYHEIRQIGSGHAVENNGMQTIPLIINQKNRGTLPGMKIKINGSPPPS
jgi:hypothetical protein